MITVILLIFIIIALALVVLGVQISQRVINILLLIIAAAVLLNSVGWRIQLH